jgi:molybdate transport system regulatory protein
MEELAMTDTQNLRLWSRIVMDGKKDPVMGPGKAQLLDLIRETGSISAAGRAMGMSYRRAWLLVDATNTAFRTPLVERARGGSAGGGAHLTEAGIAVLAAYRALQAAAAEAAAPHIATMQALLGDMSERK